MSSPRTMSSWGCESPDELVWLVRELAGLGACSVQLGDVRVDFPPAPAKPEGVPRAAVPLPDDEVEVMSA